MATDTSNFAKSYEVLVEELTVHRTVSELVQQDGSVKYQNGMGQIFFEGEKIPGDEVATNWRIALDKADDNDPLYQSLSRKLKPVDEDAKQNLAHRLGLPFEGYDDMEVEDILAAMRVLPSATVQRIKDYEAEQDEPRSEIVDYVIGFGEGPNARQLMDPESQLDEENVDENKAVRRLKTKEVPEDGPVEPGEGITGGDSVGPSTAYGVHEDAEDDKKAGRKGNVRGAAKKAGARRGRRDRQPKPTGGTPKGAGGGSLENEQND